MTGESKANRDVPDRRGVRTYNTNIMSLSRFRCDSSVVSIVLCIVYYVRNQAFLFRGENPVPDVLHIQGTGHLYRASPRQHTAEEKPAREAHDSGLAAYGEMQGQSAAILDAQGSRHHAVGNIEAAPTHYTSQI